MYESFFGLRERPFDLTPDPRYLVLTDVHREALSNLEYAIACRKGVTLLVGEAGSGKTTLLRAAVARQPDRVHTICLNNPLLTRDEFVETLAHHFALSQHAHVSKARLLMELESLLKERYAAGETTVLVVDEAQSLSPELFEEIRLLANIETEQQKLLQLIVAGQPELVERLNADSVRPLKQRVALRCSLRPLTPPETAGYVAGRIHAAGGNGAQVFTREAVEEIFRSSNGVPRVINVIGDNALLNAFAQGCRPVTRQIVHEVCQDFDFRQGDSAADAPLPDSDLPTGHEPSPHRLLEVLAQEDSQQQEFPEAQDIAPYVGSRGFADTLARWRRFLFEKRLASR